MQAVILAAGKSTRTYPLTLTKPKPLLKILNKPILAHLLDALLECGVEETIIVVGYKKEMIQGAFGDSYKGMKLVYEEQRLGERGQQLGTLHALHEVKHLLKDRFYVLYGDDLLHADDLKESLKHKYSLILMETKTPERFGIAIIDEKGFLADIVEKPKQYIGNLASVGGFMFDKKIFDYPLEKNEGQDEYYIPDMLKRLCRDEKVVPLIIKKYWLPTGYPWDLLNATETIIKDVRESKIEGTIEEGAVVKGIAVVGKGTTIKSGAYIEGPVVIGENCTIGPNCFIRSGTVIGNNCKVGNAVEIKNSILMDNVHVGHLSYLGDCVAGDNVNFGAGTITANWRHDNISVKSMYGGQLVDSGRRKLGAIIADNVHTGINTSIYPGRKIFPNKTTMPGEVVRKDIE